jgi:hypothetical protein
MYLTGGAIPLLQVFPFRFVLLFVVRVSGSTGKRMPPRSVSFERGGDHLTERAAVKMVGLV